MAKRRWGKWGRRVAVGALALAGLMCTGGYGWLRVAQSGDEARLKAMTDRLDADDPGWRFDELNAARDATLPPPEGDATEKALAAVAALPGYLGGPSLVAPVSNRTPDPAEAATLAGAIPASGEALTLARAAGAAPGGGRPYTAFRPGPMPSPFFQPSVASAAALDAANLLRAGAAHSALTGNAAGSLSDCGAILGLASGGVGDEPSAAGQWTRVQIVASAVAELERTLAWNSAPPADQLARLQALLLAEHAAPRMLWACRGERALLFQTLGRVHAGELSAGDALAGYVGVPNPAPTLAQRAISLGFRPMARRAQIISLERLTELVAAAKLPDPECDRAVAAASANELGARHNRGTNPFTGENFADALGQNVRYFAESDNRLRARLGCAVAALACERFRLKSGRWPATLGEIPPELLASVPTDPYTGKPVEYTALGDGAAVWTAGPDWMYDNSTPRTPDGKVARVMPTGARLAEFGFRLWNPDQRRAPAKPGGE